MLQIHLFYRLNFALLALATLAGCSGAHPVGSQPLSADNSELPDAFDAPPTQVDTPLGPQDPGGTEEPLETAYYCAGFTQSSQTGKLQPAQIDEASGLSESWAHEGLLWTHNDSGDSARVFLVRSDGALVAEVHLGGVGDAVDWEDIAVAPCAPGSADSCVFVADTGDNLRARERVAIYRFREPDLPAGHRQGVAHEQSAITLDIEAVDALWFDYPEGPRDVETLMVHPHSGAIYVVEKNATSFAPVFRVPWEESSARNPARAVKIATLELEERRGLIAMVTAGDIAPNGREFTVRTYLESYTYCAPDSGFQKDSSQNLEDYFEAVFKLSPTRAVLPLLYQSESLGYARDGDAVWLTSEGVNAPILRVERAAP